MEVPCHQVLRFQEDLKLQRLLICDKVGLGCTVGRDQVRQDRLQSLQIEVEYMLVRQPLKTTLKAIKCHKFKSKDK
jgi:hypothetical protein